MWCKNADTTFLRFVTNHAFDGRTDRQAEYNIIFSSLDRVCIPCSAVTKSSATTEIAQVGGYRVAVQGHSRSLILGPIEARMRPISE